MVTDPGRGVAGESKGAGGDVNALSLIDEAERVLTGTLSEDELREAAGELRELVTTGLLMSEPVDGTALSPENRGAVIKAMCLHAAHDCNMRCAYCFAEAGEYSGEKSLLSYETGKAAVDFLLKSSGSRRNIEIDFFGGEPLLNFDVVKRIVLYARGIEQEHGKNIRFTITTNGLLLDRETEDFINEHFHNAVISLDGRRKTNDRVRKTAGGKGTYDLILENLLRFARSREDNKKLYYVRGTYTAWNKDFSEDVRHLAELGFANISVEPVVSDPALPYSLTEADLPELLAEYDKLAELVSGAERAGDAHPFEFFHFKVDLAQGPCVFKRVAGCGAGTEYVAVAPNGDIYPCHRFVGDEDFLVGNVHRSYSPGKLFDTFNALNVESKPKCRDCWAKYYCSGGCHATAYFANGDLAQPHSMSCELEKKRLEIAIGLAAEDLLSENE
jgi:uncharacterized protein